jgi:hypothetical protein
MAALSSAALAKTRASLARRTQSYPPEHAKIVEAQRNHKAAKIADFITRNLANAPELTREQIDQLHVLLEPARRELSSQLNGTPPATRQRGVKQGSADRQEVVFAAVPDRKSVVAERLAELDAEAATT